VGFLRRLLVGATGDRETAGDVAPASPAEVEADERERELELARFEQDRTDDLVRRQQRFANYAWTPPAQGGDRRADDADAPAERET
jgi:hypothetical protein